MTRSTYRMENVDEPCKYPVDTHAACAICGLSRKLWVIPRCFYDDRNAKASGVVALESTAKNDGRLHQVLRQQLQELQRLFTFADLSEINFCNVPQKAQMLMLSRETANYVPWILRRVEQIIHVPLIKDGRDTGKQTTRTDWSLDLEIDPDWFASMLEKVESLQRQWLMGGVIDHAWRHHLKVSHDPIATLPPATERFLVEDNSDIEASPHEVLAEVMAESPRDRLIRICQQLDLPRERWGIVNQVIDEVSPGKQADLLTEQEYQKVVDALLIRWAIALPSKEITPEGNPVPLFMSAKEAGQTFSEIVKLDDDDALRVVAWAEYCRSKKRLTLK